MHISSTIRSIIIVLPCLVWVSCIKELSGQKKSRRFRHGGAFAFLRGKLSGEHVNIRE